MTHPGVASDPERTLTLPILTPPPSFSISSSSPHHLLLSKPLSSFHPPGKTRLFQGTLCYSYTPND
ncbi:hypothetical protein CIHG_08161 [Coccidioides immitis H538.4]|uniref:Uncharacterized protein n=1 Tax=Coccidioides immitis H538.4 TaxID=396776 RepID=A0A0J8RZT3_COCIT|nr:hypothetical protein CIHG_08161 [Coccidioides immitis H538.4]